MSLWSRIANVLRGDRFSREIEEEFQSHIEEAIEQGRDPAMLALPAVTILAAALLAALPPIIRAVRIDPATVLRAE